jgi:cytosine/adenosine deaminase-related metal-dependent hydrolase
LVQGGWIVGFDGKSHTLWRDGVLVYEDDRVLHVGRAFDSGVDRELDARGKLVSPGFIDTHVHAGHRAAHRLISDTGRRDFFGQPFLEITVARTGLQAEGDPGYAKPEGGRSADRMAALFTVAELLRNGTTTFIEFGSHVGVQAALRDAAERWGIRAYLGPGYDAGRWVAGDRGQLQRVVDARAGWRDFAAALDFVRCHDGAVDGRVRCLLVPREVETCGPDLLEATRRASAELGMPVATHAAYSVIEFFQTVLEQRMTPIEVLDISGLLGPKLIIGHGNFVAENPLMNYSGGRDLALIAERGASISHCPVNLARRARALDCWERYRKAGVNIALGTDTFPRDMIMQMRMASYFGKVMSRNLFAASAAEVFEAATLGGARALGREDLGRLAPGAKADVVIIDLKGRDSLRYGPVRDPIKSLVDCGIGDDVETVIVDGVVRLQARRLPGLELEGIRAEAQQIGEDLWARMQDWDALGRTADEMSPWSFPVAT